MRYSWKNWATPKLALGKAKMGLLLFCLGYYLAAGLAINVGYHRCLSHRALRLSKWLERIFITLGLPAGTPIQWVGNHRYHHKYTDDARDPHSPVQAGFWYAHVGWYIGSHNPLACALYSLAGPLRTLYDGWHRPRTNQQYNALATDVAADQYYRWISRPLPYLSACLAHVTSFFGAAGLLWGIRGVLALWLMSVLIYNLGDAIDSIAHLYGARPFAVTHAARNNVRLAILTMGEGWHANHHAFPRSARHGLLPGQFDGCWAMIRLLQRLGLADAIVLPEAGLIQRRLHTAHRQIKRGETDAIYGDLRPAHTRPARSESVAGFIS
jgi:fatty-acid desaturase